MEMLLLYIYCCKATHIITELTDLLVVVTKVMLKNNFSAICEGVGFKAQAVEQWQGCYHRPSS